MNFRLSQDYRLWCELTRREWLGTIPEVLCYVRYHEKRQSFQHKTLQIEWRWMCLSDHLTALTGETWSRAELEALRAVGMSLPDFRGQGNRNARSLGSLVASGTSDLTPQDREELAQMSAFRHAGNICGAMPGGSRLTRAREAAEDLQRTNARFPDAYSQKLRSLPRHENLFYLRREYPPGLHGGIGTMTQLLEPRSLARQRPWTCG